jgi:hypothetical protein
MKFKRFNRYSLIKIGLVFIGCLYFIGNILFFFIEYDQIRLYDENFIELSKCPLCYGNSYCNNILKDDNINIKLNYYNLLTGTYTFNKLVNIKNVFNAIDKYSNKIIVKKLAHNDELMEFDLNENKCENNICIRKIVSYGKHHSDEVITKHTLSKSMLNIEAGNLSRMLYRYSFLKVLFYVIYRHLFLRTNYSTY